MLLSNVHNWQGHSEVKQILVFGSVSAKMQFEEKFRKKCEENAVEDISDSNLGAIYKLRAVKNSAGKYSAIIRCGVTGVLMSEIFEDFETPELALRAAYENLDSVITKPEYCDFTDNNRNYTY